MPAVHAFLSPTPGPEPGGRAPSRMALAAAQLSHLPVTVRAGPPNTGYVTVVGQAGSAYARVRVTLAPDTDLHVIASELPAHLASPPAWAIPLPDAFKVEFVDGYQRARRACLPHGGLFVPSAQVRAGALPCGYAGAALDAFRSGADAYLRQVLAARTAGERGTPDLSRTG